LRLQIYPEKELLQGKLDLISRTNMIDFAMEIFKELHETEEPPECRFMDP
jgi:translation initiation factor 3 subunit E